MSPGRLEAFVDDWESLNSTAEDDSLDELGGDPIVVVGFAMRFPQDASTSKAFWKLLSERHSAMTDVPSDRFNIDAFYDPTRKDTLPTRGGHFITGDIGAFDAEFFGVNPSEAASMDPAQRILLETTYEAFESAGITLDELRGSNTSVHTGCFTNDYLLQIIKDPACLPTYGAIGASLSMLANRVSWFYDLNGPSVNLDSACSSSAMAIDQACQLLRSGGAEMGVVAGCNLIIDPDYINILSNMSFLSQDGRCFSFDSRANGYSRGEGVGVVLLKPLSRALQDNDTIRAVIRAARSNQDGRTPGITQPNSKAQARLIKETYRQAGLSLKHTRFFEAHGTGTPIGDPAEANAIISTFGNFRSASDPIYVGALKSNIGHLEGAAGIAALIKTILILEKGVIVPNTNFEKVNSKIDTVDTCLKFPTECTLWPRDSTKIRRASLNCFGYGGSNCHIVVDDAHSYLAIRELRGKHQTVSWPNETQLRTYSSTDSMSSDGMDKPLPEAFTFRTPKLLVWSAIDEPSVHRVAQAWQKFCTQNSIKAHISPSVEDIAYTLDTRRTYLPWRSYSIINSIPELNRISSAISPPAAVKTETPRLAFIFTGQGAQWYAMGRELFQYEIFARTIDDAEAILQGLGCSWSVREELHKNEKETRINDPDLAQPLCTILQVGIVDLLRAVGVKPHAVVGHSMGEVAAAYCAGAISRHSAFKLAYFRGYYVAKVPERSSFKGGMMAVGLSPSAMQPYFDQIQAIHPKDYNLMVSCINSPLNVTVSGEISQLDELERQLLASGVFARRVKVSAAYHSPQMNGIVEDCLSCFGKIQAGYPDSTTTMISSVSGVPISFEDLRQASYWVTNMVCPVDFLGAVQRLCSDSRRDLVKKIDRSHLNAVVVDNLIEIGPHSALGMPVREIFQTLPRVSELTYSSVLQRKKSASHTFLQLLGDLYSKGFPVDIRAANELSDITSQEPQLVCDAPYYPFNHAKQYWHEGYVTRSYKHRQYKPMPLLGSPVVDWNPLLPQWRYVIRQSELPWLGEHKVGSQIVYPAAAMLSTAIMAASQLFAQFETASAFVFRRVRFRSALPIQSDAENVETRISMQPISTSTSTTQNSWEFTIYALQEGQWSELCSGGIEVVSDPSSEVEITTNSRYKEKLASVKSLCSNEVKMSKFYQHLKSTGLNYGPSFQGIASARHGNNCHAIGEIDLSLPTIIDNHAKLYAFHPASLDAFLHFSFIALNGGGTDNYPLQVPTGIEKLWISAKGLKDHTSRPISAANVESKSAHVVTSSAFAMSSDESTLLAAMEGLEVSTIGGSTANSTASSSAVDHVFKVENIIDVDLLSAEEALAWLNSLREEEKVSVDSSMPFSPKEALLNKVSHYISVLSQKRPGMDILEISTTSTSLTNFLNWDATRKNDHAVSLNRYTLVCAPTLQLDQIQDGESDENPKMEVKHLDFHQDISSQDIEDNSFDLLVAPTSVLISQTQGHTIQNVRRLLRPNGRLVLHGVSDLKSVDLEVPQEPLKGIRLQDMSIWTTSDASNDHITSLLRSSGFVHVSYALDNCSKTASSVPHMICATLPESEPPSLSEINIIADSSSLVQMSLATHVSAILSESKDIATSVITMEKSFDIDRSAQLLVCLVDTGRPFFANLKEERYGTLKNMMSSAGQIIWVTHGGGDHPNPSYGMIDGLAKVVRIEYPNLELSTLALDELGSDHKEQAHQICQIINQMRSQPDSYSHEDYLAVDGKIQFRRATNHMVLKSHMAHVLSGTKIESRSIEDAQPFELKLSYIGHEPNAHIIPGSSSRNQLEDDEVEIDVQAATLDVQDTQVVSNTERSKTCWREGSGVVTKVASGLGLRPGDRVCFYTTDGIKSVIRAKTNMVACIPSDLSYTDAAILPKDYLYATYLLSEAVECPSRGSILVIGEASSLRQAAIDLSLSKFSRVYTIANSANAKRELELLHGARLHVLLSPGYADELHTLDPAGVDCILDLSEKDNLVGAFSCISPFGKVICGETPFKRLSARRVASTIPLDISFVNVTWKRFMHDLSRSHRPNLQEVLQVSKMFGSPYNAEAAKFKLSEVDDALHSLESGRNNKISLEFASGDTINVLEEYKPRHNLRSDATYVISGGLGDLGRCLARWMVRQGVRYLILLSRSGARSEDAIEMLKEFSKQGVQWKTPLCDISDMSLLRSALESCLGDMPVIRGCIHTSAVLKDVMLEKMSFDDWSAVVQPKAVGAWNLHELLPSEMDFFILTSSVTAIIGQATQANYAAANAYLDSLAAHRVASGLKAVSLNLGALLTGGLLAQNPDLLDRFIATGIHLPLTEADVLALVEYYCDPSLTLDELAKSQTIIGLRSPAACAAQGTKLPDAFNRPLWCHLRSTTDSQARASAAETETDVEALLHAADTDAQGGAVVALALIDKFAAMVAMTPESISPESPLHAYGADSLSAIELRNWILKGFAVDVPVFDLLGASTIGTIGLSIAKKWRAAHPKAD